MTDEIYIKTIPHGSMEYEQEVTLRYEVLREPLGLTFDPANLAKEDKDFHIGAFHGQSVIGCLVLTPLSKNEVRMRQLAVNEHWRKRGIGKKLVKYAEDFAKKNDFKKMILHAREPVVPFYEQMHYKTINGEFIEVGIPHFKMVKIL